MEINVGISEWAKNVDNYCSRNFGSHAAPAERLSTMSSPFLSVFQTLHMKAGIDIYNFEYVPGPPELIGLEF